MHRSLSSLALASLVLLLAAACGGGSGNDNNNDGDGEDTSLSLTTFEAAAVVIGQDGFTTAESGLFSGVMDGDAGWDGSQLYLPDFYGDAVQVFEGVPTTDGASPSFSITHVTDADGNSDGLDGPRTVRASGGKVFLADYLNNRVLVLDSAPTADGPVVSAVVGQASLTADTSYACDAATLQNPSSLFVVGTKLIVADGNHGRVLVWNTIPTSSGQAADLALGQSDRVSCDSNRGGSVSASTLLNPTDVWSDGTRLLVADAGNDRVLGWNTFPTTDGQAADFVLGQASFTADETSVSQDSMSVPHFLASDGTRLLVNDSGNNRVLVWSTMPSATGALPDLVLGQGDFTHRTGNDADQDGSMDSAPSANTFDGPSGLLLLDKALVVTDSGNARYLVFH